MISNIRKILFIMQNYIIYIKTNVVISNICGCCIILVKAGCLQKIKIFSDLENASVLSITCVKITAKERSAINVKKYLCYSLFLTLDRNHPIIIV